MNLGRSTATNGIEMKTTITAATARSLNQFLGKDHNLTVITSAWKLNQAKDVDPIDVDLSDTSTTTLKLIEEKFPANEMKIRRVIKRLLKMSADPQGKINRGDLQSLPTKIKAFMQLHVEQNENCFYITRMTQQKGVAYLPIAVDYKSPKHRRDWEPYVDLDLAYNLNGTYHTHTITIYPRDLDQTIPQILRAKGFVMMEDEDRKTYLLVKERYEKYMTMDKMQMLAMGRATESDHANWWERPRAYDLSPTGTPTKVVLDLDRSSHSERLGTLSHIYDKQLKVPTHPMVPVFSLVHHTHLWVNVCYLKPYKYESIKEKLVLPATHTRLIGALVSNLEALRGVAGQSQILAAKSKSNVILSMGPPGTGKTLTAEVYAEEIKRPLYELASGYLGMDPETIEQRLGEALDLSIRLNMPLLINEADVFIRERGFDMKQNAVCAVFLRLTEYHTGLIFLTSNISSIDTAMRSRCIAEIQYGVPEAAERHALWEVQLKQFGVELPQADVKKLVKMFPKVVGRDIQNLLNLTLRFAKATKSTVTPELFAEMAIFKSIEVNKEKQ